MKISKRSESFEIPKYSLTGDLLAYLKCGLQYRFNNKGSLPPSVPVQFWFGEFIHGVMEEAFLRWKNGQFSLEQITFDDVQPISVSVANRLEIKGLSPVSGLFLREDVPGRKCRDCVANIRAFKSLYTWAPSLFPLIEGNEIPLEGIRPMPETQFGARSDYYAVYGVADVISTIDSNVPAKNRIVQYIMENDSVKDMIDEYDDYEIIIDYKGAARPKLSDKEWKYHEWQLQTYMWLRTQQLKSEGKDSHVIAGILLYLNELHPSDESNKELITIVENGDTDVIPKGSDLMLVKSGKPGSERFQIRRSIRVVPFDKDILSLSLKEFDDVVSRIETNVQSEMRDSRNVLDHWPCEAGIETCTACDVKTFCPYICKSFKPTVP